MANSTFLFLLPDRLFLYTTAEIGEIELSDIICKFFEYFKITGDLYSILLFRLLCIHMQCIIHISHFFTLTKMVVALIDLVKGILLM